MGNLEIQIHRILERYRSAVLAKDIEGFIRLYSGNVRIFDTWETWIYEGREAWRNAVEKWFASLGEETVAVSAEDIRVTGGADFAIASAIVTYTAVSAAGVMLRSIQNRLTLALAKNGGDWLIVHEHTSMPLRFDDMRAMPARAA